MTSQPLTRPPSTAQARRHVSKCRWLNRTVGAWIRSSSSRTLAIGGSLGMPQTRIIGRPARLGAPRISASIIASPPARTSGNGVTPTTGDVTPSAKAMPRIGVSDSVASRRHASAAVAVSSGSAKTVAPTTITSSTSGAGDVPPLQPDHPNGCGEALSNSTGAASSPAAPASSAHSAGDRHAPESPRVSGGLSVGPGSDASQLITSAESSWRPYWRSSSTSASTRSGGTWVNRFTVPATSALSIVRPSARSTRCRRRVVPDVVRPRRVGQIGIGHEQHALGPGAGQSLGDPPPGLVELRGQDEP